jgi:nucleotide-binding universal stress UspA family protein
MEPITASQATSTTAAAGMTASAPGLRLSGRTILVASDGSAVSHAVARVAAGLEREYGAIPTVLFVFDLSAYPVPPLLTEAMRAADELLGAEAHEQQRRDIAAKLAAVVPEARNWPVHVAAGTPPVQIVTYAERLNAALTVIGLCAHRRIDRVIRDETTLRVLRHAVSPVLAVLETAAEVPSRIIVGVDFSRASVAAAMAALGIAATGATMTLVHVEWSRDPAAVEEGATVIHELGVAGALARVREYLLAQSPAARRITIDTGVANGRPSQTLLEYAARVNADLVAVASRRHGAVERLMLGSVTDELTRSAARSLLVVPPTRE